MNRKNMKMSILVIIGVLLLSTAWAAETREAYKATIDDSGVQKVEILAGSYFFKPNDVIVKVNVPVEITIKKESGFAPHDIVLHAPEAGIDFKVELSTEQKVIKFTPTKVGKYPFYCDHRFLFWSHRAKGMEGILEVTD
jgi:plastocyanin domain-containing protein